MDTLWTHHSICRSESQFWRSVDTQYMQVWVTVLTLWHKKKQLATDDRTSIIQLDLVFCSHKIAMCPVLSAAEESEQMWGGERGREREREKEREREREREREKESERERKREREKERERGFMANVRRRQAARWARDLTPDCAQRQE